MIFFLSPLLTRWLLEERHALVFAVTSAGVLAKEFVVAPLAIYALAEAWLHRWPQAVRTSALAGGAFVVWLALQFWLMRWYGYNYAGNASTKLGSGGYLWFWLTHEPLTTSIMAQFEFGALYPLIPAGFVRALVWLKALTVGARCRSRVSPRSSAGSRAVVSFPDEPVVGDRARRVVHAGAGRLVALFALANSRRREVPVRGPLRAGRVHADRDRGLIRNRSASSSDAVRDGLVLAAPAAALISDRRRDVLRREPGGEEPIRTDRIRARVVRRRVFTSAGTRSAIRVATPAPRELEPGA